MSHKNQSEEYHKNQSEEYLVTYHQNYMAHQIQIIPTMKNTKIRRSKSGQSNSLDSQHKKMNNFSNI